MLLLRAALVAAAFNMVAAAALAAETCRDPDQALGVARIVEIDAANGPVFGSITSQLREKRFLEPKEVVLTFDDGPMPGVTRQILDTLDRFCTKATFFSVGRMALAYPALVRDVLDRGHTLGTHTWSHPLNLPRLGLDRARDQIDAGFAAVTLAAGRPVAPFFRFPGLSDSGALLTHLRQRGVAAFTVDVVSNDSYISDPTRLIARTLERTEAEQGGILLFHDIKVATARALPTLLSALKTRGYRVVHLRSKTPYVADERYIAAVKEYVARSHTAPGLKTQLLAMTADSGSSDPAPSPSVALAAAGQDRQPPVTNLAPPPRERIAKPLPPLPENRAQVALGETRQVGPGLRSIRVPRAGGDAITAQPAAHPAGGGQAPSAGQRRGGPGNAPAQGEWAASYSRRISEVGG
jgi:peptidoglycan-N-acetylglucosamine deacetylase